MNGKTDLEIRLKQFSEALIRFDEALKESPESNPLAIDGAIQRFEFCYELCWKTLKGELAKQGFALKSPRASFQKAYALDLIEDEALWLQMIDDRNLTSHTYEEETALRIYEHLPAYSKAFKDLRKKLPT